MHLNHKPFFIQKILLFIQAKILIDRRLINIMIMEKIFLSIIILVFLVQKNVFCTKFSNQIQFPTAVNDTNHVFKFNFVVHNGLAMAIR